MLTSSRLSSPVNWIMLMLMLILTLITINMWLPPVKCNPGSSTSSRGTAAAPPWWCLPARVQQREGGRLRRHAPRAAHHRVLAGGVPVVARDAQEEVRGGAPAPDGAGLGQHVG